MLSTSLPSSVLFAYSITAFSFAFRPLARSSRLMVHSLIITSAFDLRFTFGCLFRYNFNIVIRISAGLSPAAFARLGSSSTSVRSFLPWRSRYPVLSVVALLLASSIPFVSALVFHPHSRLRFMSLAIIQQAEVKTMKIDQKTS